MLTLRQIQIRGLEEVSQFNLEHRLSSFASSY